MQLYEHQNKGSYCQSACHESSNYLSNSHIVLSLKKTRTLYINASHSLLSYEKSQSLNLGHITKNQSIEYIKKHYTPPQAMHLKNCHPQKCNCIGGSITTIIVLQMIVF